MKLHIINQLDEAIALSHSHQIEEGIISDLVASGVTNMQTWLKGHSKVVKGYGMEELVNAAKKLKVSLLDDNPEANAWWKSLFVAFQEQHGFKINPRDLKKLTAEIKAKIEPEIDRDLEDIKKRLEDIAKQRAEQGKSNFDANSLFKSIFGDEPESEPSPRRRRRSRRELADVDEESKLPGVCVEGMADTISNALDMLDPKKRAIKGAALIRASNNAKIAAAAINVFADRLPELHDVHWRQQHKRDQNKKAKEDAKKTKDEKKKLSAKTNTALKLKFEIAQAINYLLDEFADIRRKRGRDKDYDLQHHERWWLENATKVLKQKYGEQAAKLGVNLNIKKRPTKKYPTDFKEFRKQYAPKQEDIPKQEKPVQAEIVDEPDNDYTKLMDSL